MGETGLISQAPDWPWGKCSLWRYRGGDSWAGGRGLYYYRGWEVSMGRGRSRGSCVRGAPVFAPFLTSNLSEGCNATFPVDVYVGWVVTRDPGPASDALASLILPHWRERRWLQFLALRAASGGRRVEFGTVWGSRRRPGSGVGRERTSWVFHPDPVGEGIPPASAEVRRATGRDGGGTKGGGASAGGAGPAVRGLGKDPGLGARGRGWALLALRAECLLAPEGSPDGLPGSRAHLAGPRLPVTSSPFPLLLLEWRRRLPARPESRWLGRGLEVAGRLPCASVGGPRSEGLADESLGRVWWGGGLRRLDLRIWTQPGDVQGTCGTEFQSHLSTNPSPPVSCVVSSCPQI